MNEQTLVSTTDTPEQVQAALGVTTQPTEGDTSATSEPQTDLTPAGDTVAATPDPAPVSGDTPPAAPPKKDRFGQRIGELVSERNAERAAREAAERRATDLEARMARLEGTTPPGQAPAATGAPPPAAATAAPVTATEKPREEDFESQEAFVEALTDWKLNERFAREHADQVRAHTERQAHEEQAAIGRGFLEREAALKATTPDYQEALDASEAQITGPMQQAILRSEQGPSLAYHFATHPDDADRLSKLTLGQMLIEMGRLEERVSRGSSGTASPRSPRVTAPVITNAPAPMTPVNGGGTPRSTKAPGEMTFADYKAWRKTGGGSR